MAESGVEADEPITGDAALWQSGQNAGLGAVSVVVPVFNSVGTLGRLVERLRKVLDRCVESFEIILVDDGSLDASWGVITELARRSNHVRGIKLRRNYGQHNALLAGIRKARFDVVATLDDDLQNPPEELPRLLVALRPDVDVVYGAREAPVHGFARSLSSSTMRIVLKEAMGAGGVDRISPFRVFRRSLIDGFATLSGPTINIDVLLSWSTTRFAQVPVRHEARAEGRSNYTFGKLLVHTFNLLTGFSTRPLRLASFIGFAFTLLGFGILIYVVVQHFVTGSSVQGFGFLASLVSVFAGAQLFTTGVIGEYLARMYHRMMERPSYLIAYMTGEDEEG